MAAIKFSKQSIQPNPMEVDYWVDITSNPYGGNIKYFNGYDWVDLLNAKGKPVNLDAYYNKLQMNQMLSEKASVESVNSKVDDTEVADVIKNIEFKDRGDDGVEMVVLKYNDMTVGVTLPVASNTTSGIITNKSFKDLVKQNQLQGVYSEMYDKLSEIRQQYQRKLKAGNNIQIDSDNTIHAIGEISLDWDDVYNKPDFDKLFATVALAIQSESTRAKNAEQQLSARITDHVDVVEGKLDLKADANSVYTKDQIDEKISGIYKIKGSRTFQDLPTSGNTIGDVYNITNNFTLDGVEYPLGTNVVYTATGWDALAGIFDSTEIENKVDEIDTKIDEEVIRAKEKELELDKKFDKYLPLSGGIIVNTSNSPLKVATTSGGWSGLQYVNKNGTLGHIGIWQNGDPVYVPSDLSKGYTMLHEGNYSNYALPLTGGTISSKSFCGIIIDTSANENFLPFKILNETKASVGYYNNNAYIANEVASGARIVITDQGKLQYVPTRISDAYTIYHEGNFNPSDYLPLSGGTVTGVVQIIDSNVAPFIVNTNTVAAGIQLMSSSDSGYFLYYGDKDYYVTNNNWTNKYKIWHEGNDGEGSGLDADMLDGIDGSVYFASRKSKNIDFNQLCAPNTYEKSGQYHLDNEWSQQNAPFPYGTLLAFNSNSAGIQLASSGPLGTPPDLKYRKRWLTGFSDWKTIAFTDSDITGNAATATKLSTPIKLWGNNFDGSSNVNGYIRYVSFIHNTDNVEIVNAAYSNNDLTIGWGTAAKNIGTSVCGYDVILAYGVNHSHGFILNSSGNITIGNSDLAGTNHKLHVAGQGVFDGGIYGPSLAVHSKISSGEIVDWYGVSWSEDSSDPTCTRIGNAALHRSLPIQNAMKGYVIINRENPVSEGMIIPLDDNWNDQKYTWATNNVQDGFNHITFNVMVKIPEFWYIDDYEPSTKTHNLKISQTAKAGWCHHKEAYVGAYEGSYVSLGYRSKKGEIPLISWSRTDLRNAARANGYEDEYKWNIYTYEEHRAICHLFLVEYATRNSQAPVNTALTADGFKQGGLGSGCTTDSVTINGQTTYSFIPTGTTDSLGNGSGQVAYTVTQTDADGNEIGTVTRYANRYRGIENPFGHIWKHVDDIVNVYNAETTYKTVYKCNKPEHFATNKNAKYKPLCSFPGGSKMQGWSKEIKATINCDFFKYSVGGSESTYWCDYNYDDDDTTEHCLLIGGRSGNGGWAGLFYFGLDNGVGPSSVTVGSRLTYLPWAE